LTKFSSLLLVLALSLAPAAAYSLNVNRHPELGQFIDQLAEKHDFSPVWLRQLFGRVRLQQEVLEAIARPKESLPWHEYKSIFLTDQNIERGRRFWQKNEDVLLRAQNEYGVASEIIVAILGVETQYGRHQGRYRVIDALTTLTLNYAPRREFFRRELEEYLLLTRALQIDPLQIKGSYAGAIGAAQFIPSSYRQYAVDFDGDHKPDLIRSTADAIGSVANFLKRHGWRPNEPVSDNVQLEGTLYVWIEKLGIKPMLSLRHLISYGILPQNRNNTETRASLVVLEGETGPLYRLGYNNFYVITRYNRSRRYAMAVYELGEQIRKRREDKP